MIIIKRWYFNRIQLFDIKILLVLESFYKQRIELQLVARVDLLLNYS